MCFMKLDTGFIYNVLISCAHMSIEYLSYKYCIEVKSTIIKQAMIHHIMACSGYVAALFAGYGMPGIANASLLCEFSSIFLCYKDMFTKEERNTQVA